MQLHLAQLAPPPVAGASLAEYEPADIVRTFVFMSNLAAQEATGDAAASTSPERVLNRLQGSTESLTYLFPVISGRPPLGEVSELGLPLLPSAQSGHLRDSTADTTLELDPVGFIHISLPLLEERNNAEIECVLDVEFLPLPGEELTAEGRAVTRWMATAALDLTRQLGRSIAQVGVLYSSDPAGATDPLTETYRELGFIPKHSEQQMRIILPENPAVPLLPAHLAAHVWQDYQIPEPYLDQVLELLTIASVDAIHGDLSVEPITWTRARLAGAHGRLRDRKSHTLLVALIATNSAGTPEIVTLTELSHQEHGDQEVAEWTLTVTQRHHRRQGFAWAAKLTAIAACTQLWPTVRRTYTSVAEGDTAMQIINARLGAEVLSTSAAWELQLD